MIKETIDKADFIKSKNLDSTKDTVKKNKYSSCRLGENFCNMFICLTEDLYPEYTKNSYNSIIKRQTSP